ncbi:MAG: hypothetical protein RLZZ182_2637 [Pseudomonadota bacterium]|jgi:hypothetical protein
MPTRPESPDPSGSATDTGAYAGLSFFQDWMKAASSALPHLTGAGRHTGSAWTMPTLDPEELDKRIQDLKTVQFWLEQNARMIGMTIQTLEVQRMTLNTLRSMNMPMDAVRDSLKAGMASTQSTPADNDAAAPDAEPPAAANPLQWWNTLTQQFSTLAQQAVQAGQDAVAAAAPNLSTPLASGTPASKPRKAARKTEPGRAGKQATAPSAPTRKPRSRST